MDKKHFLLFYKKNDSENCLLKNNCKFADSK